MAERIGATRPAIERLREVLFTKEAEVGAPTRAVRKLNDSESIWAEYYDPKSSLHQSPQLMVCAIKRNLQTIMEFRIGVDGLDHLWFRNMTLRATGGSEPIEPVRLREGVGVASFATSPTFSIEKGEWEKFQALGDKLADWMEGTVRKGRILSLPFQLASET